MLYYYAIVGVWNLRLLVHPKALLQERKYYLVFGFRKWSTWAIPAELLEIGSEVGRPTEHSVSKVVWGSMQRGLVNLHKGTYSQG